MRTSTLCMNARGLLSHGHDLSAQTTSIAESLEQPQVASLSVGKLHEA